MMTHPLAPSPCRERGDAREVRCVSQDVATYRLSRHRDRLELQVQRGAQFLRKAPSCIDVVDHDSMLGVPGRPTSCTIPLFFGIPTGRSTTMCSAKPTAENRSSENSPRGTLRENPHTRTGCTVTLLAVRRPAAPIDTRRARRSTA